MKRFGWILLLFVAAAPAWAARKITVEQLKETLVSLHQAYKEDAEVATRLKEVELSEELTPNAKKGLAPYVPGPLSEEQLSILEGRSAFLPPPASDLPAAPPPDAAAQKAIVARAQDYAAKTYMQNPRMTASKVTVRFQDDVRNMSSAVGLKVDSPNTYAQLSDIRAEPVECEKGTMKSPASKTKTKWGENGQISEGGPGPNPGAVLQEAASSGKIDWLRWQTIGGKKIAVLSFAVDKKKTHFDVNYCCFPNTETQAEIGTQAGGVQPVVGNIQSLTSWTLFKKVVGYHGELFIDPDTGAIVRLITRAELKPTDFVHQDDMRIDYGPVVVNGKEYVLPVDSFTVNEIVPNGDSYSSGYSVRHNLLSVKYQNYR